MSLPAAEPRRAVRPFADSSSSAGMSAARSATEQACRAALAGLAPVAEGLARLGLDGADFSALVGSVNLSSQSQEAVRELKRALGPFGVDEQDVALERFLLLQAARRTLDRLDDVPVSAPVKELLCEEFRFFADPPPKSLTSFHVGQAFFVEMAKLATRRRFPAGHLQWEVNGLPRRWLARVPPYRLPHLLHLVGVKLGGFRPLCEMHVNIRRRNPSVILLESAWHRSYYRLATSLELQPGLKGMLATSWLFSAETRKVHPQLAWLTDHLEQNGALITDIGGAAPDTGFLVGSPRRSRLHSAGEFKPRVGLVIWPRDRILEWAARHPELAEGERTERSRPRP